MVKNVHRQAVAAADWRGAKPGGTTGARDRQAAGVGTYNSRRASAAGCRAVGPVSSTRSLRNTDETCVLHRLDRHVDAGGNLLVGVATSNQTQHLLLAAASGDPCRDPTSPGRIRRNGSSTEPREAVRSSPACTRPASWSSSLQRVALGDVTTRSARITPMRSAPALSETDSAEHFVSGSPSASRRSPLPPPLGQ